MELHKRVALLLMALAIVDDQQILVGDVLVSVDFVDGMFAE